MKTTVDIAGPLFEQARAVAAAEGMTFRQIVEAGLRLVLAQHPVRRDFRLRDARFGGRGLRRDYRDGRWDDLRDAAYSREDR